MKSSKIQYYFRHFIKGILFAMFCCTILLPGCGYAIYTKSSLPFDAIQIDRFVNRTSQPKLEDKLFRALTEEFVRQGIPVLSQAEYKLGGVIRHYDVRMLSEKSGSAAEYEVIIESDLTLFEPSGEKRVFKDIGSPFIVSFPSSGTLEELVASKDLALDRALQEISQEIVGILIYGGEEVPR